LTPTTRDSKNNRWGYLSQKAKSRPKEKKSMKQSRFPKGWDEERVKRVLDHYENQTENEAVVEDEAAWEDISQTFVEVPNELVPAVRELLAKKVA
jgi:hypothetical protein